MIKQQLQRLYKKGESTPVLRKRLQDFSRENISIELLKAIEVLSQSSNHDEQSTAAHSLIPELYFLDPRYSQKIIFRLANSGYWGVREEAAVILKQLNNKHFKGMIPVYKKWINSGNDFIQRAISVGIFGVKDNWNVACEILEPILKNPDRYVRINLGPFGLAWVHYKDPKTCGKHLKKWIQTNNENILWNIVMIFSQAEGKRNPDEALEMIRSVGRRNFAKQNSSLVNRGCASVLYNVAKHHPQKVQAFIDKNRNKKWFTQVIERAGRYLKRVNIHLGSNHPSSPKLRRTWDV